MRNRKSKKIVPIIIGICVVAIIFLATREFSPQTERVEQPLENNFLK